MVCITLSVDIPILSKNTALSCINLSGLQKKGKIVEGLKDQRILFVKSCTELLFILAALYSLLKEILKIQDREITSDLTGMKYH